jgi:hypothetical protein
MVGSSNVADNTAVKSFKLLGSPLNTQVLNCIYATYSAQLSIVQFDGLLQHQGTCLSLLI